MDIIFLNKSLEKIKIIDNYISLIWSERFHEYGDFELYLKFDTSVFDYIKHDYYLRIRESDYLMIIEDIRITFDGDNGEVLIVTGRSLESILTRRIINEYTVLSGSLQDGIKRLLNKNIIDPSDIDRWVSDLEMLDSEDTDITNLTVDAQYRYDELYESIKYLCQNEDLGFRIKYIPDTGKTGIFIGHHVDYGFEFSILKGEDRSKDQLVNSPVIFSTFLDNISSSDSTESIKKLKTICYTIGNYNGSNLEIVLSRQDSYGNNQYIDRRETFMDVTGLKDVDENDVLLNSFIYNSQVLEKVNDMFGDNGVTAQLDASVIMTYNYGVDFALGDIVSILSEHGVEGKARIIEMVRFSNGSEVGYRPIFKMI